MIKEYWKINLWLESRNTGGRLRLFINIKKLDSIRDGKLYQINDELENEETLRTRV